MRTESTVPWWALLVPALALVSACGEDTTSAGPDADNVDIATDAASSEEPDATTEDQVELEDQDDVEAGSEFPPPLVEIADVLDYVDPFIGSGGLGYGYASLTPAVQTPFGMVRLGPDTTVNGVHVEFSHFSGYNFDDRHLRGFSHLHFVGTGAADYGNVRVLPLRDLGDREVGSWFTLMEKAEEHAEVGYYRVPLPAEGVTAELTTAPHTGVHRYTFEGDETGFILFDAAASVTDEGVVSSSVSISATGLTGHVLYDGGYVGRSLPFTLYFDVTIEPEASSVYVWNDDGFQLDLIQSAGVQTGGVFVFDSPDGEAIELQVGVSVVDANQARANRETETDGLSFDEIRDANRALWVEKLSRVRVGGVDENIAPIFFTALYNVYRMPTRFDGVDGRYRGLDGEVHTNDGWVYYTDLSLWDTFRTLHPWLELTDPEAQRDCLRSLVAMYEDGGAFPIWPAALSYTGGMIGDSADMLFAGSALKGIDGIDYEAAFDGLLATATAPTPEGHPFGGRDGIDDYLELGYVPSSHDNSVSVTLELAWADWSLANLADHLGRPEATELRERGHSYRNLFESESRFFLPRSAEGDFDTDIRVDRVYMGGGGYTEGSAWHWRFYAFQDPDDLVELFGSSDDFGDALEEFFARSALGSSGPVNTIIFDPYYWHGNEPTIHSVFLFHTVNRYDRLAYWVREIQTRLYSAEPGGLPGNDDGGTMSSWYAFNAIGLYPLAGSDLYALSTPLVPYAVVDMGNGEALTIEAPGASIETRYVTAVTLNGEPVEGGYVQHAELANATLRFALSDSPVTSD